MLNNKVIIHIGFPKTATTFLQTAVFPYLKNTKLVLGSETFRDVYYFDRKPFNTLLLSDELLSGFVWSNNFERNMQILKTAILNPTILICYRNQADFIWSLYLQSLRGGHYHTFEEYFNLDNTGKIKIEDLLYTSRQQLLASHFDNIISYDFDFFKKNKVHCVQKLLKKLNLKLAKPIVWNQSVNPSIKTQLQVDFLKSANKISQRLNGLFYNKYFRKLRLTPPVLADKILMKIPAKPIVYPTDKMQAIQTYFQADWEALQSKLIFSNLETSSKEEAQK